VEHVYLMKLYPFMAGVVLTVRVLLLDNVDARHKAGHDK
jgi:hypothetical protein